MFSRTLIYRYKSRVGSFLRKKIKPLVFLTIVGYSKQEHARPRKGRYLEHLDHGKKETIS